MASVTYKIGGKYDGKAMQSAQKDLKSIGNSVKNVSNIIKGFAVVKVAQKVAQFANAGKSAFVAQNQALTKFNTAVQKSNLSLTKLNNLKKELSHGNFIDDDSLNNAMALGVQMGLTNEQLEEVMKTATDLSSAGLMPLDQAVKKLGQSYTGELGELKQIAPELSNLTKEQLKNGEAVEILRSKYDGFATAMSNSFSGRDTQWTNSMSDFQSALGSIPKSLEFLAKGELLEPLNKITEWIVANRDYILNFIIHIPEVAGAAINLIKNMIATTFTGNTLVNIASAFLKTITDSINDIWDWIGNLGNNFAIIMVNIITDLAETIKEKFTSGFSDSADSFLKSMLTAFKNLLGPIQKIVEFIQNPLLGITGAVKSIQIANKVIKEEKSNGKSTADINKKYFGEIVKVTKDFGKNYKNNLAELGKTISKSYDGNINQFIEDMEAILGQDLPEDLKAALSGITIDAKDDSKPDTPATSTTDWSGIQTVGSTLTSSTGEVGSLINAIINNGVWGAIAELLAKMFARIEEVMPLFQWFEQAFSEIFDVIVNEDSNLIASLTDALQPFIDGFEAVKDILGGLCELVAGILNFITPILMGLTMILNKVAPIVASVLELVGLIFTALGTILEFLNPILEVVLNVLSPVLEVINWIIRAIYKVLATIVNWIIDIYNAISWGDDKDHISTEPTSHSSITNGYQSYTPDLSAYTTATASTIATTSGSASYTAAKDIYVNIYYNNSYVNGDARAIALNIRDEIRSAEKLGY